MNKFEITHCPICNSTLTFEYDNLLGSSRAFCLPSKSHNFVINNDAEGSNPRITIDLTYKYYTDYYPEEKKLDVTPIHLPTFEIFDLDVDFTPNGISQLLKLIEQKIETLNFYL